MNRFLTKLVGGVPARRATKGAPRQHRRASPSRLRIEALDDRCVPAVFTVTNTGDNSGVNPAAGAGTGTFRQALVDAMRPKGSCLQLLCCATPAIARGCRACMSNERTPASMKLRSR